MSPYSPEHDAFDQALRQSRESYLTSETAVILDTVKERLDFARQLTAQLAGSATDIRLVGYEVDSRVGSMPSSRLRFIKPPQGSYIQLGDEALPTPIRELVIEVPQAYTDVVPELIFTTIKFEDGEELHHAITQRRIMEVDPEEEGIEIGVNSEGRIILHHADLPVEDFDDLLEEGPQASDEEIAEKSTLIFLYSELLNKLKLANQSRTDGTAA